MALLFSFLPRIVQFFGIFQSVIGFVQPLWPFIATFFTRRAAA
ncbi:hypothetical protein [Tumebacillus avium]|nr:hypothetical protein [Tumebacillus avium]